MPAKSERVGCAGPYDLTQLAPDSYATFKVCKWSQIGQVAKELWATLDYFFLLSLIPSAIFCRSSQNSSKCVLEAHRCSICFHKINTPHKQVSNTDTHTHNIRLSLRCGPAFGGFCSSSLLLFPVQSVGSYVSLSFRLVFVHAHSHSLHFPFQLTCKA